VFVKKYLFYPISKNNLWKGAFILGSGTALAQLIGILTTPIITRLFTPYDFGLLGLYSSIIAVSMTLISLRYEFAIPVPKESEKAAHLLVLCFLLIGTITFGISVVLILMQNYLVSFFDISELKPFFWLIILGCFGSGIYQALNYWAIRQQDYNRITSTRINQGLSGSIFKIIFGLLQFGSVGLLLGFLISRVAGIGTFLRHIIKNDLKFFKSISISGLKKAAREFYEFPLYTLPATFIYTLSLQIPIFFLSIQYNLEIVGWYTLAYQMLALPTLLIANSVAQVFYGEAAKTMNENPLALKVLFFDTVKKLTIIAVPVIGIPAILAPGIFPIVFGGSWVNAGIFALPLAIVAIGDFILVPTNKLAIYGYNRWQLIFHIFRLSLVVIAFYLSYLLNFDVLLTLFIYGGVTTVTYILLFFLNLKAINQLIEKHSKIE